MTNGYYHGYLAEHSGRYTLGAFTRVRVGKPAYRLEFGDEICPLLVLLPGGRFLAGATLGDGMATSVCLDVLPDVVSGHDGYSRAWRSAYDEAWYRAGEEARLYAEHMADDQARYADEDILGDEDGFFPVPGYIPAEVSCD